MTLNELTVRKANADALPESVRYKYAAEYADICEQILDKIVKLAMACNDYTQAFVRDMDDWSALIAAAREIERIIGRTP